MFSFFLGYLWGSKGKGSSNISVFHEVVGSIMLYFIYHSFADIIYENYLINMIPQLTFLFVMITYLRYRYIYGSNSNDTLSFERRNISIVLMIISMIFGTLLSYGFFKYIGGTPMDMIINAINPLTWGASGSIIKELLGYIVFGILRVGDWTLQLCGLYIIQLVVINTTIWFRYKKTY